MVFEELTVAKLLPFLQPYIGQLGYAGVGYGSLACLTFIGMVLVLGIGLARVLVGAIQRSPLSFWQPGNFAQGPGWYQRLQRCHANVTENMGFYVAVILAVVHFGEAVVPLELFRLLCAIIVFGRIGQTLVYLIVGTTEIGILVRFSFFAAQQFSTTFLALCVLRTIFLTPTACSGTEIPF